MKPNRRQFFRTVGAGAAGLTLAARSAAPSFAAAAEDDEGPVLRVGDDIAVARTQHGRVRGTSCGGSTTSSGSPTGPTRRAPTVSCPRRSRSPGRTCSPPCGGGTPLPRTWSAGTPTRTCRSGTTGTTTTSARTACGSTSSRRRSATAGSGRSSSGCTGAASPPGTASSTTATTARTSPGWATSSTARSTTASARSATATCPAPAASGSPRPATWACWTSWPPSSGCATTSRPSAATPAT